MPVSKVAEQTLLALQSVAGAAVVVGSAYDVSTYYSVDVKVRMGRGTGTAFGVGPIFRIEGSYLASPTADDWVPIAGPLQCALGTSIASQAVSGTEASGQTVVTLAAGTNFAKDDYVFFHNTTIGNSEWCRVLSVSGADLTLEEGLVNAQTGATCRDQAEIYHFPLDVTNFKNIRIVVVGDTTQASIWEAMLGGVTQI